MAPRERRTNHRRATLADVAKHVGVSGITVSRVINHPDKVSPGLRQRVQEAIDKFGYVPNQSASSLASTRSRVLGVVIPSLSNTVFTDVMRGIYDAAGSSGYKVLMVDTHYSPLEEERLVRTLLGQSPEAMILTGGEQTESCRRMLLEADIPLVQTMDVLDEPIDMNVGISHYDAGWEVAHQLLAAGYKKIGFLGARMDTRTQKRFAGFKDALVEKGCFREKFVLTTTQPSSVSLGVELFRQLMEDSNGDLEAIFCCNDDLALGALFETQRMGINIPTELGLCGFNDFEVSAYTNPSLSSVRVPRYEMGATAAEMVINALQNKPSAQKQRDLGFEFIARESTVLSGKPSIL